MHSGGSASVEAQPLSSPPTVLPPHDRVGTGPLVGEVRAPPQAGDEDVVVVAIGETIVHARPGVSGRLDANPDFSSVSKASKLKDANPVVVPGGGLTVVARLGTEGVWSMVCLRPAGKQSGNQSRAKRQDDCCPFHEKLPSICDSPYAAKRAARSKASRTGGGGGKRAFIALRTAVVDASTRAVAGATHGIP